MKPMERFALVLLTLAVWLFLSALAKSDSGHVIVSCKLEASDHEKLEGYFNCSTAHSRVSFAVPRNGIPADVLREHLNGEVEILIRRREPRKREEIIR
jgi:hypothetical protein